MQTFIDAAGRSWSISLNLGSAIRVRDRLKIDLLQPELGDPPLLDRLGSDELLLGEIICVLLEPQFAGYKTTADDVRAGFDGATLLAANEAFFKELIDFFRRRGRTDRAKAVEKQLTVIQAGIKIVENRIDKIDETKQINAMSERADAILGDLYGSSEADSASTSEPSPSES